jgi:hypothetical protein
MSMISILEQHCGVHFKDQFRATTLANPWRDIEVKSEVTAYKRPAYYLWKESKTIWACVHHQNNNRKGFFQISEAASVSMWTYLAP